MTQNKESTSSLNFIFNKDFDGVGNSSACGEEYLNINSVRTTNIMCRQHCTHLHSCTLSEPALKSILLKVQLPLFSLKIPGIYGSLCCLNKLRKDQSLATCRRGLDY